MKLAWEGKFGALKSPRLRSVSSQRRNARVHPFNTSPHTSKSGCHQKQDSSHAPRSNVTSRYCAVNHHGWIKSGARLIAGEGEATHLCAPLQGLAVSLSILIKPPLMWARGRVNIGLTGSQMSGVVFRIWKRGPLPGGEALACQVRPFTRQDQSFGALLFRFSLHHVRGGFSKRLEALLFWSFHTDGVFSAWKGRECLG